MEGLVAIIAILAVFGIPGYLVKRALDLRHDRLLAKQNGGDASTQEELEGLREERKLLVGRIENLESIVTSVDFELNQKLNKLTLQSAALALPPASDKQASKTEPTVTDAAIAETQRQAKRLGGELEVGATLAGRYRISRPLGRGGMGAVYLADDQALDEQVALKVVSSAMALNPVEATERFRREAQAARRVAHDNVIRIHDLGDADGLLYLSMEYFAGKSLDALIDQVGPLDRDQYLDIIRQICDGLAAAHKAGVVHRDLKPANVLIGERNAVKIIDFGLATSELLNGLTATGQMLGTPTYMSPEQVRCQAVDARSDIYSLGALAYRAITGVVPFEAATPIAIGFAHLMETPTPVGERRSDVPAGVAAMIERALAKSPGDRPQTVAEFKTAFAA